MTWKTFHNTSGNLHVVIEFCPGGNLRNLLLNSRVGYPSPENSSNYINMTSTLNHRQLLKIAVDISNGMVHLSSQKVFREHPFFSWGVGRTREKS
jgi:serine/threonine protein kinase